MERKITVIGVSEANPYETAKGEVINFHTVYYTFESKNVQGLGCGTFSLTEKKLAHYNIAEGGVYNACFSYDSDKHRQNLEGLFEV